MTKPLLSTSQLRALQGVALAGMQVAVVVKRPDFGSDDSGDGAFDESPAVVSQSASVLTKGVLLGYLRQTGGDTTGGVDVGSIVTTSTYELGLPVGTDILARDIVVINSKEFFVQDVLDDETWPGMLDAILRHRS